MVSSKVRFSLYRSYPCIPHVFHSKRTIFHSPFCCFVLLSFDRAVFCADEPSLCDVDEMFLLADELEKYQGCFFEGGDDCEKEKMDRLDVAGLLRLEAEVQLRHDYLENANLFKEDVQNAKRPRAGIPF